MTRRTPPPCPLRFLGEEILWEEKVKYLEATLDMKRLQHFQSKCMHIIAGAPWYVSNLQLHEYLEVPYIAEHIRNLALSFDSKIPIAENLTV